jgi:prepilin-type processing-associated H-X9-DG protein
MRLRLRIWLIVVALSAVLLTAVVLVGRSREAAGQNTCSNNLRQISLGMSSYASAYLAFPYGTIQNSLLPPQKRLSWLVILWAFLDQWFWMLDMSRPWDDDVNRITRGHGVGESARVVREVRVFSCPLAAKPASEPMPGMTSYVGVSGLGRDSASLPKGDPRIGIFGYDRQTFLAEIKDGLATTMAVAETTERGPWTAGGANTLRGLDPDRKPYLGHGRQFGGNHRDGAMLLFADGSVRLLRESIDPKAFEALSTIAGGEHLPAGWDD